MAARKDSSRKTPVFVKVDFNDPLESALAGGRRNWTRLSLSARLFWGEDAHGSDDECDDAYNHCDKGPEPREAIVPGHLLD